MRACPVAQGQHGLDRVPGHSRANKTSHHSITCKHMGTEGVEYTQTTWSFTHPVPQVKGSWRLGQVKAGAPGVSAAHKLGSACNSISCESSTVYLFTIHLCICVLFPLKPRAMGMPGKHLLLTHNPTQDKRLMVHRGEVGKMVWFCWSQREEADDGTLQGRGATVNHGGHMR